MKLDKPMGNDGDGVRNGHLKIRISEDLMTAEVDFHPPGEGGEGLTMPKVLAELKAAGVNSGIDEKTLEARLLECLSTPTVVRGVVAARGTKVKKSVPAYWHLKKRLLGGTAADLKSPHVDHRDRSPYVLVKKGEPLAKRVPESPGEPGRTVTGELLPVSEKDIVLYRPGENILEKDGILYAASHGRFDVKDREMTINETLDIPGNVDYSTGHIAFPGDVIIHGSVCDGFRVAAGKSLFVKQTMDATQVLSRGDLVVEGGIKGRGEARVKAEGRVRAKFVENVTIESRGDVVVEKAVMHSRIFTLGRLILGDSGTLIGGEIWALGGMVVGSVGRPDSPAADIRIGSDFLMDRKLRHVRAHIERLEAKLDKLKARASGGADRETLIHQAEGALEKMRRTEGDIAGQQHPNEQARLVVAGSIDAGNEIHIGALSMRLSSPMEKVTFYYEDDGPRIGSRPIHETDLDLPSES